MLIERKLKRNYDFKLISRDFLVKVVTRSIKIHYEVTLFLVAICMNKTKILFGQLNCSIKLVDVSTRCSSHPQALSCPKRIFVLFKIHYEKSKNANFLALIRSCVLLA